MSDDSPSGGTPIKERGKRYLSENTGIVVRGGLFIFIACAAFAFLWGRIDHVADDVRKISDDIASKIAGDILRLQIETSRDRETLTEIRTDIKEMKAILQHRPLP